MKIRKRAKAITNKGIIKARNPWRNLKDMPGYERRLMLKSVAKHGIGQIETFRFITSTAI